MPEGPDTTARIAGGVRTALPHDSAHKHVSGRATYVDDILEPEGILFAAIGVSDRAHAKLASVDLAPVRDAPGVLAVLSAADIPGINDIGPAHAGDPVFADGVVECVGQSLFAVAATDVERARRAAKLATVVYEDLPPLLTIEDALARESFVLPTHALERGDPRKALAGAAHRLCGTLEIGGQDHFYLEGQVAMAIPAEDGDMLVFSSTQHPTEVQHAVAKVLGRRDHAVTVEVRRMGGGFGGKETQAALFACVAALLADRTGRPVKLRLDRDDDMIMTGKRHDFRITYDVGFDPDGRIQGIDLQLASRCGMSPDLSGAVNDRAMFHSDNAYYLANVAITSHRCKTNTVSNTAFRGFGGPQGMLGIEYVMEEIASHLGRDALDVRMVNLYGVGERDITPYHMQVEDNILPRLLPELEASSDYRVRRQAIRDFNAASPVLKRGLALTPVKFGIAFTTTFLNQGGALVHVYLDGSIHLNHGGTEMGQGVMTKVAQIVAEEFQVDIDRIKITSTTTGKVPNTPATAASSGTDLNGKAAQAAACTIKERLIDVAANHLDVDPGEITFRPDGVHVSGDRRLAFTEVVKLAHQARVSLSATGFFRTPKINYDRKRFRGRPFLYFACGAAVSEVVIDTLTGENKVLRVDILHDVGESINPAIDRGQVEGGFVQGMGWLTTEELHWSADGRLETHSPSTYKIPACGDLPADFRVQLVEWGNTEDVIYRSKAVGEPPLMLALSVFCALKDAVASVVDYEVAPRLHAPATPERILMAVADVRARRAAAGAGASRQRTEPAPVQARASDRNQD